MRSPLAVLGVVGLLSVPMGCGSEATTSESAGSELPTPSLSSDGAPGDSAIPVRPADEGESPVEQYACELQNLVPLVAYTAEISTSESQRMVAHGTEIGYDDELLSGPVPWDVWHASAAAELSSAYSGPGFGPGDDGSLLLTQIPGSRLGDVLSSAEGSPLVVFGSPVELDGSPALYVDAVGRNTGSGFAFLWPCATSFQAELELGAARVGYSVDVESVVELMVGSDEAGSLMERHNDAVYQDTSGDAVLEDWDSTAPAEREFVISGSIPSTYREDFMKRPGIRGGSSP